MTPLAIIKYIVEHLEGTAYAPWVNAFLFMLLVVAVLAAVSFLLGRSGRSAIKKVARTAARSLSSRKGYAPHWEEFRLRVEPYAELLSSLYFAFVGLYSAALVGLAALLGHSTAPWWALLISVIWVLASFYYMRVNLEAASWAHHKIKQRRG